MDGRKKKRRKVEDKRKGDGKEGSSQVLIMGRRKEGRRRKGSKVTG